MIVNESPATSFTPSCRVDPGNAPRAFVDLAEQRAVVDDIPDAVADFFEADVVAPESVAEKRLREWRRKVPAVLTRRISMCGG